MKTADLWHDESGYALILTLLFMPVFLGICLFVIDISRANNAHSDLSAAADALALAGASELDGGDDAIIRAQGAMARLTNSVSFLDDASENGEVVLRYRSADGGDFRAVFLTEIPARDETQIDQAFITQYATLRGSDANYIYVTTNIRDFAPIFPSPVGSLRRTLALQATSVAAYASSYCDITPLFICNPIEGERVGLRQAFRDGRLHGRLLQLRPNSNGAALPGEYGMLQVPGLGDSPYPATGLRAVFAGAANPSCYGTRFVNLRPGTAPKIAEGLNTRFDMFNGEFANTMQRYPPAVNVRKGYVTPTDQASVCLAVPANDPSLALGFPLNTLSAVPAFGVAASSIGSGDWDLSGYWALNHSSRVMPNYVAISSFPAAPYPAASTPSRYDIYRHEIAQTALGNDLIADAAPGGETGLPICSMSSKAASMQTDFPDRRVLVAAVVNCLEHQLHGNLEVPVTAYAGLFLASPMQQLNSQDQTLNVEIIDLTGSGRQGVLNRYRRAEAFLVR